ncbi:glycosyltransferase [Bradyrhizobium genosp. L]|uniref:glycosyltransferase n=1 Tax=Bradyrhizobium genosp. L TaxID=83637 RepID=UPI0018A3366E|nr:glycosyltransferase [Bradyrhizobium genosp. L]QPF87118.1 glycosyltransferase [Bradyrhizobium genosp. L]
MKLIVWHNIMWARYKAAVFSALHQQSKSQGVGLRIYQIAETDSNRVALSPVDASWHVYPHVLLFKGPYSAIPRLALLKQLVRRTWSDRADVTILTGYEHPHIWVQACVLFLLRRRFAWFCDSTIYDNPPNGPKSLAKRVLFRMADGVFCYGERASDYIHNHGVPKDKIFIRRQAAALPKDYSRETAFARRAALSPSPDKPRYLYVGRLSTEKSLDLLLRAFSRVLPKHPSATLVLVGKGPAENALQELAGNLGISQHVQFAGAKFDESLVEEYLKATCLVLPSYSEPWGLVVNESLSFGCPAIVSNRCGCVPELIDEGQTGYSFDWGSLDDLTDKIVSAPARFSDGLSIAEACIQKSEAFTPQIAARGILEGATSIHARR